MKTKFITICTLTLTSLMLFSSIHNIAKAEDATINVTLNGIKILFPDAQPFTDETGRALLPVRFVSEALGAKVDWDEIKQEVNIIKETNIIKLKINDKNIVINGTTKLIDTAAIIKDSRTFIPVRFVAEALGANVGWEKSTKTVVVTKPTVITPEIFTYEDKENGFSFQYTNTWRMAGENIPYFASTNENATTGYYGSFKVEVGDLSSNPKTFEQYRELVTKELISNSLKMESVDNKEFCGLPGCYMTYGGTIETYTIKAYTAWTIKDNKVYTISYLGTPESFEKDKDALDIILKSAKIK